MLVVKIHYALRSREDGDDVLAVSSDKKNARDVLQEVINVIHIVVRRVRRGGRRRKAQHDQAGVLRVLPDDQVELERELDEMLVVLGRCATLRELQDANERLRVRQALVFSFELVLHDLCAVRGLLLRRGLLRARGGPPGSWKKSL